MIEGAKPNFKEDWWRFLILGATGVYMNQLFFILGLKLTSANQAAIMQVCSMFKEKDYFSIIKF